MEKIPSASSTFVREVDEKPSWMGKYSPSFTSFLSSAESFCEPNGTYSVIDETKETEDSKVLLFACFYRHCACPDHRFPNWLSHLLACTVHTSLSLTFLPKPSVSCFWQQSSGVWLWNIRGALASLRSGKQNLIWRQQEIRTAKPWNKNQGRRLAYTRAAPLGQWRTKMDSHPSHLVYFHGWKDFCLWNVTFSSCHSCWDPKCLPGLVCVCGGCFLGCSEWEEVKELCSMSQILSIHGKALLDPIHFFPTWNGLDTLQMEATYPSLFLILSFTDCSASESASQTQMAEYHQLCPPPGKSSPILCQ